MTDAESAEEIYRDPPHKNTLRGAYHALRRNGMGRIRSAIHTPIFYPMYIQRQRIAVQSELLGGEDDE